MVGLKVIAWYNKDGLYYPGNIVSTKEPVYGLVAFNFKKKQKVRTQMIIPISGAVPSPELSRGDFVLVKVFNKQREVDCYVPGIIQFLPDTRQTPRFYTIMLYTGKTETATRNFIVKIGKARFEMAVKYIAHLQQASFRHIKTKSKEPVSDQESDRSSQYSNGSVGRSDSASDTASQRSKGSSRSSQRSGGRKKKEKYTKRLAQKSKSRKKSRSRSPPRSRSQSESSYRSCSSRSRSNSRSRSRSRTPTQRERPLGSKTRSRSGSSGRSSGSTTPCNSPIERPSNPVPKPRPVSPPLRTNSTFENATGLDIYIESRSESNPRKDVFDEKDQLITELQFQIEKQKRKQLRQEQRLVRQARKINKIQRRLERDHHNDSLHSRSTRSSGDDTDTSQTRQKGNANGIVRESTGLEGTERSLPQLQQGQEVLARWIDDGWYYRGCVDRVREDDRYIVRDATGHLEEVDQEDIIVEEENKYYKVQPQDYVIGRHPNYVFSYAPAEVLGTYPNDKVRVEFYDGHTHTLPANEVFRISKAKYENDRKYIMNKERQILGKSVVARDDDTGMYRLGVVDSHCGLGQLYYIKWLDGMLCKQNANQMFEVGDILRPSHKNWEYVLAPVDRSGLHYLPAQLDNDGIRMMFCDGYRSSEVRREQCFWLSKEYYLNAVDYYRHMNPSAHKNTH